MIERYFRSLLDVVARTPFVRSSDIALDQRSEFIGFIRGNVYFIDDSLLHFRKLVDVQSDVRRVMYAYHYQRPGGALVFRYDNTDHFPGLPNFPHHKHDGNETNVLPSAPPDFSAVLKEIEPLIAMAR